MAPPLGSAWLRAERDPGSGNLGLLTPRGGWVRDLGLVRPNT